MKKFILAGISAALLGTVSAHASDAIVMPSYNDGPGIVTVDGGDWEGFHVGVRGGVAAAYDDLTITNGVNEIGVDITGNGALLGIGAGYDVDMGGFVLGIDGDISWSNISSGLNISVPGGTIDISTDLQYLATLEGRIGVDMGNFLPYAHGGLAWGRTGQTANQTPTGGPTTPLIPGLDTQDRFGYTVGVGVDVKLTDELSLRTEYGYVDLGEKQVYDFGGGTTMSDRFTAHTITTGLSWHF